MGTSQVSFRSKHFDAPDPVLEVWLRLIVDEIDALGEVPDWLRTARDDWQLAATEEFGFGVEPNLDRVLIDKKRRDLIMQLAQKALSRLESFGDPIQPETLNAIGAGKPGEGFTKPLATRERYPSEVGAGFQGCHLR